MSDPRIPIPITLDGCRNLSQIRENYCRDRDSQDALCVFFGIHECICVAVDRSSSTEIARLNSHFANLCAKVYYRYYNRRPRHLGPLWTLALGGYKKKPNALARLLPLMAAAHIIEDLPTALYDCHPIGKEEYDAVFHHIVVCVEAARRSNHISSKAWAEILEQFRENLPVRDILASTIMAFGVAVAWVPPLLNPGVKKMRQVAWKIAQEKVDLSRASGL